MNARTRRVDGHPETPAETRFFDLRESGYQGPIDQDGNPIRSGTESDILRALRVENERLRAELDAATDAVVDLIGQLDAVERLADGGEV